MKYTLTLIILFVLSISVSASFGQNASLLQTFDDPSPAEDDQFGNAVAIDGNHILVGVSGDDTNGDGVGQAYLLDATTGNRIFTFDDPTPTGGDRFGASVAIDGNHILVGASRDNTNGTDIGQAHLFDATTGNLIFTFDDPTPTVRDGFGSSVAIDGNRVLVGARFDNTNVENISQGQAHLFDATTGNLIFTLDDPTPTFGDSFGISVSVDGNHILIGANSDETFGNAVGQAHLFDATTGNLLFTFNDPDPTGVDNFGESVAIDGNHALVGAINSDVVNDTNDGQAHLFDTTTGELIFTFDDPTPTGADRFGASVAIDGNHILVGASRDNTNGIDVGQAHLFDATTGNLVLTFDDPTPTVSDKFGGSVSIDGNRVLIDAPDDDSNGSNAGQAHLFSIPGPNSLAGDFDADGNVDGDDVDFYIGNLDQPATGELAQLDLDGDGDVTLADHDLHVTTLVVTSNGATGALLGDVDLDGGVDVLSDAFALVGSLGQSVTSRVQGDLNADGTVDVLNDAFRLIADLGQSNED